jgi:ribonuclease HII
VGRGPLAGPVVAAAVVLPVGWTDIDLDDSKALSPRVRAGVYRRLLADGARIGVGAVSAADIDRLNIYQATRLAMWRAYSALGPPVDWVVVDAMPIQLPCPTEALIGGDARCASVAAASVVAKVLRDRLMCRWGEEWPAYGFAVHKGYPTPAHRVALERWGPTPVHRRSFLSGRSRRGRHEREGALL